MEVRLHVYPTRRINFSDEALCDFASLFMDCWQVSSSLSYWHAGNILVKRAASGADELVPIDHGYVLPDTFQDISFEWLYWPQARAPFGERPQVIGCLRISGDMGCPLIAQGLC